MRYKKGTIVFSFFVLSFLFFSASSIGKGTTAAIAVVIWSIVYLGTTLFITEKAYLPICLNPIEYDFAYLIAEAYVLVAMGITVLALTFQWKLPVVFITLWVTFTIVKGTDTIGCPKYKPIIYALLIMLVYAYDIYLWDFNLPIAVISIVLISLVIISFYRIKRFAVGTIIACVAFTVIMYSINYRFDPEAISFVSWKELVKGGGFISDIATGGSEKHIVMEGLKLFIALIITTYYGYTAIRYSNTHDYGKTIIGMLSAVICINFALCIIESLFFGSNFLNPFRSFFEGVVSCFVIAIISPTLGVASQHEYVEMLEKIRMSKAYNNL